MQHKINISVTSELKKRMAEYPHVNWSKVFSQAAIQAMNKSDAVEQIKQFMLT